MDGHELELTSWQNPIKAAGRQHTVYEITNSTIRLAIRRSIQLACNLELGDGRSALRSRGEILLEVGPILRPEWGLELGLGLRFGDSLGVAAVPIE